METPIHIHLPPVAGNGSTRYILEIPQDIKRGGIILTVDTKQEGGGVPNISSYRLATDFHIAGT